MRALEFRGIQLASTRWMREINNQAPMVKNCGKSGIFGFARSGVGGEAIFIGRDLIYSPQKFVLRMGFGPVARTACLKLAPLPRLPGGLTALAGDSITAFSLG